MYVLIRFFRCNHQYLQNRWTLEVIRKKTAKKDLKNSFFHLTINFYGKNIFLIQNKNRVNSDRSELDFFNENIRIWNLKSIPNFISKIEDLNYDCDRISLPSRLYFQRNKPLKNVTVGPGRFIVWNDSASPKMIMKMYFNIFLLLFWRF